MQTYRPTHVDRPIDRYRQTDRQIDRLTDKLTDTCRQRLTWQTETYMQTYIHAGRDIYTVWQTGIHTQRWKP